MRGHQSQERADEEGSDEEIVFAHDGLEEQGPGENRGRCEERGGCGFEAQLPKYLVGAEANEEECGDFGESCQDVVAHRCQEPGDESGTGQGGESVGGVEEPNLEKAQAAGLQPVDGGGEMIGEGVVGHDGEKPLTPGEGEDVRSGEEGCGADDPARWCRRLGF